MHTVLEILTNEKVLGVLGTAVAALIAFLVRRSIASRKFEKAFDAGVEVAYAAVSRIAPITPTKIDDLAVVFLKALKDHMATEGHEVTPEHEERAKAAFLSAVGAK
jgi:hypothetical protein